MRKLSPEVFEQRKQEALCIIENAGFTVLGQYQTANAPLEIKCNTCGGIQRTALTNIKLGTRCTTCQLNKSRFTTEDAKTEARKRGYEFLDTWTTARPKYKLQCLKCGNIAEQFWSTTRKSTPEKPSCLFCSGKRFRPDEIKELFLKQGLQLIGEYQNANTAVECICLKCNRTTFALYCNVMSGKGICRACAEPGFNPTKPGLIYLIEHTGYNAYKIGIANVHTRRLRKHQMNGWQVVFLWNFTDSTNVYRFESAILKWLRVDKGLPVCLEKQDTPQAGYTETVSSLLITAHEIREAVQNIVGDEYSFFTERNPR